MKKIVALIVLFAITSITTKTFAQGFGAEIHLGYLTEIETAGFGGGFVYDFNDTWGLAANGTVALKSIGDSNLSWLATDLNVHYTVFDNLYALAGGQYLSTRLKDRNNLGGFALSEQIITSSDFGVNVGAGYRYNIIDNVSAFTEIKYVAVESGYIDARLGLHFGF